MREETETFERSDGMVRVTFYHADGFYYYEEEHANTEELPEISDEVHHLWIPVHSAGLFASPEDRRADALLRYDWLRPN